MNDTEEKFPEFALWVIWETIHTASLPLKLSVLLLLSRQMTHETPVLPFISKYLLEISVSRKKTLWKLYGVSQRHYQCHCYVSLSQAKSCCLCHLNTISWILSISSSKWIHEFLIITTSHSQGTNIRCIIARIAAGLLYYINALVGHVQSSFVLDIRALSQSTKLRSKTTSQCNYLPLFVATWPLYQTKGLLFIIMSNMKTY